MRFTLVVLVVLTASMALGQTGLTQGEVIIPKCEGQIVLPMGQGGSPDAAIHDLQAELANLTTVVQAQNQMLVQLLNPPKSKHRKIVKVLLMTERIATDVGSAASISSVLGWVRP